MPLTRNQKKDDANSDDERRRREEDIDPAAARSRFAPTATPHIEPAADTSRRDTIAITEDQLARLISNVMRNVTMASPTLNGDYSSTPTPSTSSVYTPAPSGNFSRCTSRFDGVSRSTEEFEVFVDAITVFKECTAVSDEHALRGLALLLTDEAAIFWRGIKSSVTSWDDAIRRLRAIYGAPRPAYKIFRDIFAKDQSAEDRAEHFISRVRANFAQLPYSVPIVMQTDIIYGLLDKKIRKRVPRDSVTDPDQLLEFDNIKNEDHKRI